MGLKYRLLLFVVTSLACCGPSRADSFGVNIYGLSYHMGQYVIDHSILNEVNVGIGFRVDFGSKNGDSFFIEGGMYEDSFNNAARYISIAYQVLIWNQLRLGLNAAIYNTKSTNNGESFLAPIPILSYRVWRLTLNTVYLPKYEPINPFHVLGAYLTINLIQNNN